MEAAMCRICLEAILYPICIDCLFSRVNRWLEERMSFVAIEVALVHQSLKDTFPRSRDNVEQCVVCTKETKSVICPYCYIREVYHTLRQVDETLAEDLARDFNFDFEKTGMFRELSTETEDFTPVNKEEGICEVCSNYYERLYLWGDAFVCEECMRGEEDQLWRALKKG